MRRSITIALTVLLCASLIAWRLIQKNAQSRALVQQRLARSQAPPQVSVVTSAIRDVLITYNTTGSLQAPLDIQLSPKVSGRIIFLQVHEGDRVSRGQVLVRLDSEQIEANVRQQAAALLEAQYRLAQTQTTLDATDVSVATQIAQQTAALSQARTAYKQLSDSYDAQLKAAQAAVDDAQGRIDTANANITSAQAAINSASANLADATIHFQRLERLYAQGFVAGQDVDDAKATSKVQQAALDGATGQLASATGAKDSAIANKQSALKQLILIKTKADADLETSRQSIAQADAALKLALANRAQSPAYRQGIAALQSVVQEAKASLAAAQAQRSDTILRSPVSGFVTRRPVDPGSLATPGQTVLNLQTFGDIWATFAVPDDVSTALRVGQQVTLSFDALPARVFTATIVQLNPAADTQGRQFTVRASLDNRKGLFKPGMFAHVTLATARANRVVTVPPEALHTDQKGPYVVVVDKMRTAHLRRVTPGLSDGSFVALTTGLQAGESVVVLTGTLLKDGQRVVPNASSPGQTVPAARVY